MSALEKLLSVGDLRSVGECELVISKINNQNDFDALFKFLYDTNRIIVMHTADVIEKITTIHPEYLITHEREIMELLTVAKNKELKWHLALLVPRIHLDRKDCNKAWKILMQWAKNKTNSKLVRVGALQGLFEMTIQDKCLLKEFNELLEEIGKEQISSVNARIRNIRKHMD